MNVNYIHSESTVRPQPMEVGMTSVYLRRNIQQVERTDKQGQAYRMWEYEEAAITLEEFNTHSAEILLSYQMAGNSAQLDMMEAIADLSMMVMEGGVM